MQKYLLISLIAIATIHISNPVSAEEKYEETTEERGFVILKSTKDYNEAKSFAITAAQRLSLPLDLRGLTTNSQMGLSRSAAECEDLGGFPCYEARGAFDKDFPYISVEYSTSYETFTPGYYIVVAATHLKNNPMLNTTLNNARKVYPDAYMKTQKVYTGCTN